MHRTAYCQNRFELKHWSPSMFCCTAPAWPFLTDLPWCCRGGGRCSRREKKSWGAGGAELPCKVWGHGDTLQQPGQMCSSARSCAAVLLKNLGQSVSAHVQVIMERSKQGLILVLLPFFFFFLTNQVATLFFCQFTKLD